MTTRQFFSDCMKEEEYIPPKRSKVAYKELLNAFIASGKSCVRIEHEKLGLDALTVYRGLKIAIKRCESKYKAIIVTKRGEKVYLEKNEFESVALGEHNEST